MTESGLLSNYEINELGYHWHIFIYMKQQCMLFLSRYGLDQKFPCTRNWNGRKRLIKLYNKCETRLNNELDLVKLIKMLRQLKIVAQHSILDDMLKYQIEHSDANVIDIESGAESDLDSCAEECAALESIESYIFKKKLREDLVKRFGMKIPEVEKYQQPSLVGKDPNLKAAEVKLKLKSSMYKFMVNVQRVVDQRNADKVKEGKGAATNGDGIKAVEVPL